MTSFLSVVAYPDEGKQDPEALALAIASTVFEVHPELIEGRVLSVEVKRGFDFGIAQWTVTQREAHDAPTWRAKLRPLSASPKNI